MVKHMQRPLWDLQAIPGKLLASPTPELVKETFYRELFIFTKDGLKPKRLKDTEGFIVLATDENYDHIFFKRGAFLADRGARVYWIRKTIVNARHIITDKDNSRRLHYLQPYKVGEIVESFCVVTERKRGVSFIVTAFPVDWERVCAILQSKGE